MTLPNRRPAFHTPLLSLPLITLLLCGTYLAASDWQKKVPEVERSAQNPLANDTKATAAGAELYAEKCAKCHGESAEGKGHHPSLRSSEVQNATPGELNWVITHGTGMHGMPGFGKLTGTERWQLVSYIKSLGTAGTEAPAK